MLNTIRNKVKKFFSSNSSVGQLEEYIIRHNPQSILDVENLEREYYQKKLLTSY